MNIEQLSAFSFQRFLLHLQKDSFRASRRRRIAFGAAGHGQGSLRRPLVASFVSLPQFTARKRRLWLFSTDVHFPRAEYLYIFFVPDDWHVTDNPPKDFNIQRRGKEPPNAKQSALKSFYTHFRMDYPAYVVIGQKFKYRRSFTFFEYFGFRIEKYVRKKKNKYSIYSSVYCAPRCHGYIGLSATNLTSEPNYWCITLF